MNIKRFLIAGSFIALLATIWVGWPVYGFFAHRGSVPPPPFGWFEMPDNAPVTQQLNDPEYESAGDSALSIISKHRDKIGAPSISAAVSIGGQLV
jgi:hypothetical protein